MEVHAPEHPIHTWRDFAIHIATITIGLLIALGLEAAVEALHHHHQRNETRADLRAEIADSRKQLPENLRALTGMRRELQQDLVLLHSLRAHQPPAPGQKLRFAWQWSSMPDSAWKTARETGVLALFSNEQVEVYSATYGQQDLVNQAALILTRQMTQAEIPLTVEPDLVSLTPALIDELIRSCASNLNQITYVETLAADLDPAYKEALEAL